MTMFDPPSNATGIDLADLKGTLLLIQPHKVEIGINTTLGPKDAIVADVHLLDGGNSGTVHKDAFIWPKVLQGQIRGNVGTGRYCLGRLTQGVAKPGQNPPWKLDDPNPKDSNTAAAYLAKLAAGDDEPPF